jgi:hypothetical protein
MAANAYGATINVLTYMVPMLASAVDSDQLETARTNLSGFINTSTALQGRGIVDWSGVGTDANPFVAFVDRVNLSIANVARASNVATITTSAPHGLAQGDRVQVAAVTNTGVNGVFTLTSAPPTTTTFTYASTGANITSGADTGTVAKGILKLDGTDKAIRIMGLTGIPRSTDTQTDESLTLDAEDNGATIQVASSNSFSYAISGLVDRKSYAWKMLTMVSDYGVLPGLAVKFLRIGPAGSTEAQIGFGRVSVSEDGDAGTLQKFSGTISMIGSARTIPDNTGL